MCYLVYQQGDKTLIQFLSSKTSQILFQFNIDRIAAFGHLELTEKNKKGKNKNEKTKN